MTGISAQHGGGSFKTQMSKRLKKFPKAVSLSYSLAMRAAGGHEVRISPLSPLQAPAESSLLCGWYMALCLGFAGYFHFIPYSFYFLFLNAFFFFLVPLELMSFRSEHIKAKELMNSLWYFSSSDLTPLRAG